jgi:hypothetical protein
MVDNVGIERVEQEDIEELKVEDSVQTPKQDVQYKIEGEEVDEEEVVGQSDFYANLAEELDETVLNKISSQLVQEYKRDKDSRRDWEDGYTNGLDLLGFKYTQPSKPFRGASGVTHPLLAEAVTQFQAQAYKELLPSDGPVKSAIVGVQNEETEDQASRVKDFMNYQLTEKMEEYTPEMDQLLFYLPLAGSAFKKVYYDSMMDRAVAKFIPAEDLVVPYYTSSLLDCERITHVLRMSENDLYKKMESGFYRDVDIKPSDNTRTNIQKKYDELEGKSPTQQGYQYQILEIHVDLNLEKFEKENENEKKVKIPYIVTIDEGSGEILSIYRNYEEGDKLYKRKEYFVHYKFLPGLGFYGFGLIHMIGGLSRTATQALRQLLDAGTLANLPAGFKSRGIRIRDDDQPFQPGEFRDVDAPGGNIRDQFQILPFKEPSQTLYSLLGFVVQAGQRFANIADMAVGEDAQNRAVGTTLALLERGSRVMSAIHKRCYYSMRQEFRLLHKIFATYLPPLYPYQVYGADRLIKSKDFDDRVDVLPVADPNTFSVSQRVTLASEQLKIAMSNPAIHDIREAYRRVYEALGTQAIDSLLLPTEEPIPKDPALENMDAMGLKPLKPFATQDHEAHMEAHMAFMKSRMVQINPQVYAGLQAHISEHISLKANQEVVEMMSQDPNLVQLSEVDPESWTVQFNALVAKRVVELTSMLVGAEGGQQDPLVALKSRELDLKAMDMQRKSQENSVEEQRKQSELMMDASLEQERLSQLQQGQRERIRIAEEKLDIARIKEANNVIRKG